jgi:hypothetical protein
MADEGSVDDAGFELARLRLSKTMKEGNGQSAK